MMVIVMARFEAREGCEDSLVDYLVRTRDTSRIEGGCVSYDVFADTCIPTGYVVIEVWRDEAARQSHIKTALVDAFRRDVPLLLRAPYSVNVLSYVP